MQQKIILGLSDIRHRIFTSRRPHIHDIDTEAIILTRAIMRAATTQLAIRLTVCPRLTQIYISSFPGYSPSYSGWNPGYMGGYGSGYGQPFTFGIGSGLNIGIPYVGPIGVGTGLGVTVG